ncbi:hypothetical protein GYMLUDRAFT_688992 [Collybiopsis luxurians FD-317 M1]|uniref:Unplaced genomic scaffold GYMLUscaffold_35, whole genome shotgun sequence n=1 Tax=Collybiopsis luxurians FD-317 M1 TaxID=944289 RepID=A0A0D0CJT3_9AGAR|nr:hypothetical protein GYMLUDRAFT_594147 [Collybiopsis luxurians FD-317 M1]KIK58677.1 hypothetical protein GYMLUDRAFT_688992 [Collybiopsis luxurians FD-317 M1]
MCINKTVTGTIHEYQREPEFSTSTNQITKPNTWISSLSTSRIVAIHPVGPNKIRIISNRCVPKLRQDVKAGINRQTLKERRRQPHDTVWMRRITIK